MTPDGSNMKCEDCKYLRSDIKKFGDIGELSSKYGKYTSPCNRYPQNILRAPKEPACGEFKPRKEQNHAT